MPSRGTGAHFSVRRLKKSIFFNVLVVLFLSILQTLEAMPYPPGPRNDPEPYYRSPNDGYSHSDFSSLADINHGQGRGQDGLKFPGRTQEGRKDKEFRSEQVSVIKIKKGSESDRRNEDQTETETKYYYGGKFTGSCTVDGLYYRDDTTFIICSNGYPHAQPCPPGTRTAGYPRYKAGYYYGYTDLCSVNLVDYGYGPEYYAPKGYSQKDDDDENGDEGDKRGTRKSSSSSSSQDEYKPNYDIVRQGTRRNDGKSHYAGDNGQTGQERVIRKLGGRNDGSQPDLHYSNHLGSNKQGGAGYGLAKMADTYSESQRENLGSSAYRKSGLNDKP